MEPRVEALRRRQKATLASDKAGNDKIVLEAKTCYQACKKKYVHWSEKTGSCMFLFAVFVGAVPTCGISFIVGGLVCIHHCEKISNWQALKNACKEIGQSAAKHADMKFTQTSEGAWTFVQPIVNMVLDDFNILDFLNDE